MAILWKSKTFWTAVVDMVGGILALVVGTIWPQQADLVKQIWGLLQPIFLVLILTFCTEEIIVPSLMRALR
jgi:hypothetical protein